jgi:ribosomal protein S18 acetylase RimI-like enzyme
VGQPPRNVRTKDGALYFKERFPAKSTLTSGETTIALFLLDNPVAYIQFLHSSSPTGAPATSSILITGLEVQEECCGQGYAKHICEHIINMYYSECDLRVAANVHNLEAVGLYTRLGFKIEGIWYNTFATYQ